MDLYHKNQTHEVHGPWNDVNNILPDVRSCKVKAKLQDNTELFACFYADKAPIMGIPTNHFWNSVTKEPIDNVTHWKALRGEND